MQGKKFGYEARIIKGVELKAEPGGNLSIAIPVPGDNPNIWNVPADRVVTIRVEDGKVILESILRE